MQPINGNCKKKKFDILQETCEKHPPNEYSLSPTLKQQLSPYEPNKKNKKKRKKKTIKFPESQKQLGKIEIAWKIASLLNKRNSTPLLRIEFAVS